MTTTTFNRRDVLVLSGATAAATALQSLAVAPAQATPASFAGARFDHVSINVRNFDAALAWYQQKLGFRVEVAWRVAALNGKRLAYLAINDARVELVEADPGAGGLPEARDFREHFARTGYGHLCFAVTDVDAVLNGLAAEEVPTFVKAETYDLDGTHWRRRVGFIKDPEGNVLEFGEPLIKVG